MTLRIAPKLELPVDVAGEAIAILAKRGAGKTNTGRVLAEELVAAKVQTVVLDPVGAWWGLRSAADGKGEGLALPILGGAHGDVPLQAPAGALIADVVVDTGQSLVLDLSDFSKTEQRRFVTDFAERLYTRKARNPQLLHLILEEADEFAPQRVSAGDARMVGAIEALVRRGRGRGIGLTMITQRSASLNKSVLEQADLLILMRTTGPRDRAAVEAWVSKQDVDGADQVMPSLPGLETGEAWIWNPERELLQRVRIRLARTFDSSSTPKAGARRVDPSLASIDLTKLGAEIEATAERAKENDPAALRDRLRKLERERDGANHSFELANTEIEKLRAQLAELTAAAHEPERVEVPAIERELVDELGRLFSDARDVTEQLQEIRWAVFDKAGEVLAAIDTVNSTGKETRDPVPPPRPAAPALPAPRAVPPTRPAPRNTAPAAGVSGPQQRILNALAALEAIGVSQAQKTQLALFAEASPKSSSFSNNLGTLRTGGLIDYPVGGYVALTPDGRAIADAGAAPQTVDELHAYVAGLVGGAKWRLLERLVSCYPKSLSKQELADQAGTSPTSSSFSNNLGSLRSLGLIDYPSPGFVSARPVLFMEGA